MNETVVRDEGVSSSITPGEVARWVDRLGMVDRAAADTELIELISQLERVKSVCAAAQAAATAAFVLSRTKDLTLAQQREEGTHRSISAQIALARRDSPFRGGRHVGLATALINEMPHTYTALRAGVISEWRATLRAQSPTHPSVPGAGTATGTGASAGTVPGPGEPGSIPAGVTVDIQLVMTDRTLLDGDNEPAILTGYGPIPAELACRMVRAADPAVKVFSHMYTDPHTGQLITADTKRHTFSHSVRQFLTARDRTCRTPWCDAPIRHADHICRHSDHGPTLLLVAS